MSAQVNPDVKVDGKKILSDVVQLDALASISEENDSRDSRSQAIVPEKCPVCEMGIDKKDIKYYDVALLKKFMSVRGKIIPRTKSGVCSMHQRTLKISIKRARFLAMLPYVDIGI